MKGAHSKAKGKRRSLRVRSFGEFCKRRKLFESLWVVRQGLRVLKGEAPGTKLSRTSPDVPGSDIYHTNSFPCPQPEGRGC